MSKERINKSIQMAEKYFAVQDDAGNAAESGSQSALRDMLTDLRHYADKHNLNFGNALTSALDVFREEVSNTLHTYHVYYQETNDSLVTEIFQCLAEDAEDAESQCQNVYPNGQIFSIKRLD